MTLRAVVTWCAVTVSTLAAGGVATAAPDQYAVLNSIYGKNLDAAGWEAMRVTSDATWSATGPNVTLTTEVKYSTGDYQIGIQNAAGTQYKAVAGVSGTTDITSVSTFGVVGSKFSAAAASGSSVTFQPGTIDPWVWNITKTRVFDTANIASNTTALTLGFTSLSVSPDYMKAYAIDIGGVTHYALLWNIPSGVNGSGSNTGQPYTSLVLDITGVKNPEPTSLALMGFGAAGLFGYRLRRRAKTTDVVTA